MRRSIQFFCIGLVLSAPAVSLAQKTKSALSTETTVNFPDNTSGQITPAIAVLTFNDYINSWQQAPRVRSNIATTDTITVNDYGYLVTEKNAGTVTVTLPQATGTFGTFSYYQSNLGAGNVVITPTVSTINGTATYTLTSSESVFVVSDGTNWQVFGGTGGGGGGGVPGGSNGQIQYNNLGSFGGFTLGGDCTFAVPNITCMKTNGVAFAASATSDATNAVNIVSGILPIARLSGSYTGITGTGILAAGATGAGFTIALTTSTVTGTLTVPNGGTGAGTWTSNLPLIGNGTSTLNQGSVSGNTTTFATASGALTNGHCVQIDSSGNFVDAGGACTTGGGGGTVSAGVAGQVAYYASSGTTIVGDASIIISNGAMSLGQASSVLGKLQLFGNTSGSLTLTPQATAGTPVWTAGTSSGTPAVTASSPLAITTATGNITCSTCITTSGGAATATYPATTVADQLLYSSATNVVAGLATISNGSLVTDGSGVPSISQTLPAAVQANITALGTIATGVWNGTAIVGTYIATNTVANSNAAQMGANTWKGNSGSSTANVADNSWTSCSGSNSAVNYTNGTGTGCNTNVASLTAVDQTLSGGANVTSGNEGTKSSGITYTVDCGQSPLQYFTNGGAFTLASPANDGSCLLLMTNNGSAGAVTFSGFTVGSNTGGTLTTTNTNKFTISIWRINSVAGYNIFAHQ